MDSAWQWGAFLALIVVGIPVLSMWVKWIAEAWAILINGDDIKYNHSQAGRVARRHESDGRRGL